MSSLVRTLIGVCAAVPIALGLFFLMNSLIDRQFEQDEIKAQKVAEIVVPDKEIETNRKEELPEKVEDPAQRKGRAELSTTRTDQRYHGLLQRYLHGDNNRCAPRPICGE